MMRATVRQVEVLAKYTREELDTVKVHPWTGDKDTLEGWILASDEDLAADPENTIEAQIETLLDLEE